MSQFRDLLQPGTWKESFLWTDEMEANFVKAKEVIVEAVKEGVKHFETDRWTTRCSGQARHHWGIGCGISGVIGDKPCLESILADAPAAAIRCQNLLRANRQGVLSRLPFGSLAVVAA